ncbi:MAG TPA: carbohydrate kinase family protein [Anaerolineales bacterium]|nr:carbohydrate kinase family protein [Anaerolineales bacterium]
MVPTYVVAGHITREYILPPAGQPLLDAPGGTALYAAGGLLPWDGSAGILARVGEDYPRPWLKQIEARGLDIRGIEILEQSLDLRSFRAYNNEFEATRGSPVSQFARRGLTFPKVLLGYQDPSEVEKDPREAELQSPLATAIPMDFRDARAVHLCPLDFVSHNHLTTAFRAGSVATLTLEPSAAYMNPSFLKDLRVIVTRLTAFLASEDELQALFWGLTHDPWEMAAAIGEYGCDFIVIKRGGHGQLIYDVQARRRWEVPSYPARPTDPTGAGDAFCGGFLAGFRKTYDPVEATLYGNVSASLKMEGTGAFYPLDMLPGLAEARLHALRDLARQI